MTWNKGDLFTFEVLEIKNKDGETKFVPRYVPIFIFRTLTGEHDNTESLQVPATCSYRYENVEVVESHTKVGTVTEIYDAGTVQYKWMNPSGCTKEAQEGDVFHSDSKHFRKA